jgi:DNA modification methylase
METKLTIVCGDCLEELKKLPDRSVQCCITSPPYWGLRDYGAAGQLGLESTPEEYVARLVEMCRDVKRVLRDDGTFWLNLGDSYATNPGNGRGGETCDGGTPHRSGIDKAHVGLKPKDLCGIPWRMAFALQADGWYLRSDIIWAKPNPMPESVTDRPTKSHEYIFLLTKSPTYYYDYIAIQETATGYDGRKDVEYHGGNKDVSITAHTRWRKRKNSGTNHGGDGSGFQNHSGYDQLDNPYVRNKRDVWTVPTSPYKGSHFATFPPALIRPCILAGTSAKGCCPDCGAPWERVMETKPMVINRSDRGEKIFGEHSTAASGTMVSPAESKTVGWQPTCKCGKEPIPCTVLDPFLGSGTTAMVALQENRSAIGIELNPEYVKLAHKRCSGIQPTMFYD